MTKNNGGNIFYEYGLASYFATKPLPMPKQKLRLSKKLYDQAQAELKNTEGLNNDEDVFKKFGKTIRGLPMNYKLITIYRQFHQTIVNAYEKGQKTVETVGYYLP